MTKIPLGAYIFLAAAILALAIYTHALTGRYQFQQSVPPGVTYTIDTWTGKINGR